MFITLALAFCLGSLATTLVLIAPAMLSSQVSREEETKEVIYNKQLTFKNQVVVDAEFEECDDLIEVAPPSSGIIRVPSYNPQHVAQAATAHRKIDLYV
jgi:hypothetical protein